MIDENERRLAEIQAEHDAFKHLVKDYLALQITRAMCPKHLKVPDDLEAEIHDRLRSLIRIFWPDQVREVGE